MVRYWYILLLMAFGANAQDSNGLRISKFPGSNPKISNQGKVALLFEDLPTDELENLSVKRHTSLKPIIRQAPRPYQKVGEKHELLGIVDLNYFNAPSTAQENNPYRTGVGLLYEGNYNNNLYVRCAATQGIFGTGSGYQPKSYFTWRSGKTNLYTDVRSRVSFTPNHIFNFQVGLDHNFIGEGSRSMFLNDYGKPYPFGMARARFWRLEYSVLYQFLREGTHQNWNGKFASSHHISFNPAPWFNIGLFESVVFEPKDTLLNRGFDAEYLNPFVFYRPQEYSLGSSDNVLIGIEASVKWKRHTAYFQFILDEFLLAEIRAKNGWWANKFGGQLGIKGRFKKGQHLFFYRLESNFARPFTYSHLQNGLNYGNQGVPLAHIYGANFAEVLVELKWNRKKFGAKLFANYSLHGSDKNDFNYGADIYQPYINRPYEFGHFIGNGIQKNFARVQLTANYIPWKSYPVQVFAENLFLYNVQEAKTYTAIVIGIRSQLWNDYRNY